MLPGGATAVVDSMHIALMVDPGNDDGAPSSTAEGVGFANGTDGDFALAMGSLLNAGIAVGSAIGQPKSPPALRSSNNPPNRTPAEACTLTTHPPPEG